MHEIGKTPRPQDRRQLFLSELPHAERILGSAGLTAARAVDYPIGRRGCRRAVWSAHPMQLLNESDRVVEVLVGLERHAQVELAVPEREMSCVGTTETDPGLTPRFWAVHRDSVQWSHPTTRRAPPRISVSQPQPVPLATSRSRLPPQNWAAKAHHALCWASGSGGATSSIILSDRPRWSHSFLPGIYLLCSAGERSQTVPSCPPAVARLPRISPRYSMSEDVVQP